MITLNTVSGSELKHRPEHSNIDKKHTNPIVLNNVCKNINKDKHKQHKTFTIQLFQRLHNNPLFQQLKEELEKKLE